MPGALSPTTGDEDLQYRGLRPLGAIQELVALETGMSNSRWWHCSRMGVQFRWP